MASIKLYHKKIYKWFNILYYSNIVINSKINFLKAYQNLLKFFKLILFLLILLLSYVNKNKKYVGI